MDHRRGAGLIIPKIPSSTISAGAGTGATKFKSPGKSPAKGSSSSISSGGKGSKPLSLSAISSSEGLDIFQKLQLVSKQARSTAKVDEMHSKQRKERHLDSKKSRPRMQRLDGVLRDGVNTMKTVAEDQADIYAYDSDDMYSDTDDDDDYSTTDSDSSNSGSDSDGEGDTAASSRKSSRAGSAKSNHSSSSNSRATKDSQSHNKGGKTHKGRKGGKAELADYPMPVQEPRWNAMSDPTDPFVQLALMQQDTTNVMGQTMGEINTKDPLAFLMEQPALGDVQRFRKKLKKEGVVAYGNDSITDDRTSSVVWASRTESAAAGMAKAMAGSGKLSKSERAKQYVDSIIKSQQARAEEETNAAKELDDIQDMEVSKSRAHKMGELHEAREHKRLDGLANANILAKQVEANKTELKQKSTALRLENKRAQELQAAEKARIADIIAWKARRCVCICICVCVCMCMCMRICLYPSH